MVLRAEIPSVVVHMRHDVEKMKRECASRDGRGINLRDS